ncbi:MAG: hypothetical protein LAP21_02485 [Acidobacteriia bacterium]|nr:hypothetical protein [Terriglobia bacterium]
MTDTEILTLVDRLERCLLANQEFHHKDHLTVAVVYLYSADVADATDKMRASLSRFAAHLNVSLYHETMTRFWIRMAEKHIDRCRPLAESVERVHHALNDKNLVHQFYSREWLGSPEARTGWVEPDLQEI